MAKSRGKKKVPPLVIIVAIIIVAISAVVSNFGGDTTKKAETNDANVSASSDIDGIVVHYLDVGQGDSEFIELPNGECMLIDAGTSDSAQKIVDTITNYGYSKLDYVVATHPHADHIGGMTKVINNFDIGEIYMPKASTTTKTFENMLTAISDNGLSINTAKAGVEVYSDSSLEIEFLAPVGTSYTDLNNYSAVVKITYGSNSFLFTGDAENVSEEEMLSSERNSLSADVLKVGHHGSSSSSTVDFINAVNPKYAVISCGVDNSYGHPHSETLTKLDDKNVELYRTDKQGTITVVCDGNDNFVFSCEGK
jgi:beta-lactamase superfamily II metal-dependent hydrolase